jgi:hypothetical protein
MPGAGHRDDLNQKRNWSETNNTKPSCPAQQLSFCEFEGKNMIGRGAPTAVGNRQRIHRPSADMKLPAACDPLTRRWR